MCIAALWIPRFGSAATYVVGAGTAYPTLASLPVLRPGDSVEIRPGRYHELKRWTASGTARQPIVVRGVGMSRPILDGTNLDAIGNGSTPRALFQIEGDHIRIEHLEFQQARNSSYNGAGIRVTGAKHTVIRDCKITRCDMGMMSNDNDDLLIERCEVAFNGNPERFDGYAHNFYLEGGHTTVRFCYIHDAIAGINFKSRGHYTELLYNYIADSNEGEISLVDSAKTKAEHSQAVLIGNILISKADRTGNTHKFIDFGQDMGGERRGTLYLYHNTLIAGNDQIEFLWASAPNAEIVATGNIFYGSNHIAERNIPHIQGTCNWVPVGAKTPPGFTQTLSGTAPGFADAARRDFSLVNGSPCRNACPLRLTYLDAEGVSRSGIPHFVYIEHLKGYPCPPADKRSLGALP